MIKALALSMMFSFAAQAYTGQPKTVECKLYDGHVVTQAFNDIPASDFTFDAERPKGYCVQFGDEKMSIGNGPFSGFRFSQMGCKRIKGKLVVQPTYMHGFFFAPPDEKTKNQLIVTLIWEGSTEVSFEATVQDKDDLDVETVRPQVENCKVTEFHQ